MGQVLLYSVNAFLKQHIQCRYHGDKHYVWCSETYDSAATGAVGTAGTPLPPTSNPAEIYRSLKRDTDAGDTHSYKISEQRASLTRLARMWHKNGTITKDDRDDILYTVKVAGFREWRPIIYIIPRNLVQSRLQIVPIKKRAHPLAVEYILPDLHRSEFDSVEW